jgi:hypothetical protein
MSGSMMNTMTLRECMIATDLIGIVGLLLGEIVDLYTLGVSRLIIGMAVGLNSTIVTGVF